MDRLGVRRGMWQKKLREKSDISLHVATAQGEYGPVEDIHMIFDHLIGSYLIAEVKRQAAATG